MPPNIPGFYFDASKNKYFKIEPNHIAPPGSKHAKQAVEAEASKQRAEQLDASKREAHQKGRIIRSRLLSHPLLSFRRQLGDLRELPSERVSRQYAFTLEHRTAYAFLWGEKFAVDCSTNDLYALSKPIPGRPPEFGVTPWNSRSRTYHICETTSILDEKDLICLTPVTPQTVVWVSPAIVLRQDGPGSPGSAMYISRKYLPSDVRWNRNDFGDYGTVRVSCYNTIWDVAASPDGASWVLATTCGAIICDGSNNQALWADKGSFEQEQMCVEFMNANIYMSGARSGKIILGDVRGGQAVRLRHDSAVSALRVLRSENYILANGLQGMNIYDLRCTRTTKSWSDGRKEGVTKPVLDFEIPFNRTQKRYGLGFDYDPELNIVASASTDFAGNDRVGLWSASTGKMIASPLNEHHFATPVTCIQMVNLRGGPKSILTASDGKIEEWTPEDTHPDVDEPD